MNALFWRDRKVFVTGHTGFKGGWLCLWLARMGAKVAGFALPPPSSPSLFAVANVENDLDAHTFGEIRDAHALHRAFDSAQPEIVFHLAAQPLVRLSYAEPIETFSVNVLGTALLFEAVRNCTSVKALVNVTSDKCYANHETGAAYREDDALGGLDPYSASKACAEIVTTSYRASFLKHGDVAVASARAGNVIGGGDWASDRLLPDFFRALDSESELEIRHPKAVRPWQHVLEPVSGYLGLAQALIEHPEEFASAWNFGPDSSDARTVEWILEALRVKLPAARWRTTASPVHEAAMLNLDSGKARSVLGWQPRWTLPQALERTVEWHEAWRSGRDMRAASLAQIEAYSQARM